MYNTILIVLSVVVLIAYLFDVAAPKTRIPSVLLLMLLGVVIRQASISFHWKVPDFTDQLSVLGNIGLVLIVFEGALELPIQKSDVPMIRKSIIMSFLGLLLTASLTTVILKFAFFANWHAAAVNAIPLSIISSAVAVPTARMFSKSQSDFIVFESSFSDIFGVLVFNFVTINTVFNAMVGLEFVFQLLVSVALSFVATAILAFLLSRLKHRIRFIPIIAFMMLMYGVSKELNLPGLIMILMMGLALANTEKFVHFDWFQRFKPHRLTQEVKNLERIVFEVTFVVRLSFFLLFGYSINLAGLGNLDSWLVSFVVVTGLVLIRAISLIIMGTPWFPYLFIAPRGLITILLFLSIPSSLMIPKMDQNFIMQVVVMSVFLMMLATLFAPSKKKLAAMEALAAENNSTGV